MMHEELTNVERVPIFPIDGFSIPGEVERTEREGQVAFVADATALPIELGFEETLADYEGLGFSFSGRTIDKLFQEATLPAGWMKRATDHEMWSKIYDENGVERVEVFYKAAFYDRNAFMRLSRQAP